MKLVLEKISYYEHNWIICVDWIIWVSEEIIPEISHHCHAFLTDRHFPNCVTIFVDSFPIFCFFWNRASNS